MTDPDPDVAMGNVVEVDETYVDGKWNRMSRARRKGHQEAVIENKVDVVGILELDGKATLAVIGVNTFTEVVRQHVSPSAVAITNAHFGSRGLNEEFQSHEPLNHLKEVARFKKVIVNPIGQQK